MNATACWRILSKAIVLACVVLALDAASSRVRAAQSPYGGTAWTVPGTIEVENFDEGGEGVSFHDLTATNEGGAYRNTAVDIYASTNASNGQYVLLRKGEWLQYTVSVIQTGVYELGLRQTPVTLYTGNEVRVFVDGFEMTAPMSFTTWGLGQWNDVLVPAVVLKAGLHFVRLEQTREPPDYGSGTGVILDYFKLELSAAVPVQVIAGSDQAGFADGPPGQARFSTNISGMDIDLAGNIYVADAANYRIRKVSPSGEVSTLAGGGTPGTNDARGSLASFDQLLGVAVNNAGDCHVVDRSKIDNLNKIRKLSLDGVVSTIYSQAMVLQQGPLPPLFDAGVPRFTGGITLDSAENLYFLVDFSPLFRGGGAYALSKLTSAGTQTNVLSLFAGQSGARLQALSSDHAQKIHYWSDYYSYGANYRSQINFLNESGSSTLVYQEEPGGGMEGLLADRSGNLYFATSRSTTGYGFTITPGYGYTIKQVLSATQTAAVYRGAKTQALAADPSGNVYTFKGSQLVKLLIGYRGVGLTVFTDGGGTALTDPPGFVFQTNQVVQITATPTAGWTFLGWTNDVSSTQTNLTMVMTNHLALEAVFAAALDTPATNGTVRRDPDYALYPYGTSVQLMAQPDYGYEFIRWNDGLTNPARTVEMTNVTSLSPAFSAIPRYTLTAAALGGTGGTVSRNPDQAEYFRDTRVTVTARPGTGYVFQVWLDNVLDNPRQITITSNTTLFAAFAPGQGTGPVITAPPGDTNVFMGGQVSFTVSAQGSSPLEYQWQHNGTNISGATGPLLLLSNVQSSDAGVYTVTVANTLNTTSAGARLNVTVPFSFEGVLAPAEGQMRFSIAGPPGTRYAIEQSEDLKSWSQVAQLDLVGGSVDFTDAINPSYRARFYRARLMVNP